MYVSFLAEMNGFRDVREGLQLLHIEFCVCVHVRSVRVRRRDASARQLFT